MSERNFVLIRSFFLSAALVALSCSEPYTAKRGGDAGKGRGGADSPDAAGGGNAGARESGGAATNGGAGGASGGGAANAGTANGGTGGATGNGGSGGEDGGQSGGTAGTGGKACSGATANCDDDPADCETHLDAVSTCGTSCKNVVACKATHATAPACVNGKCSFTCSPGYGDCDGDGTNGCETNLDAAETCGATCGAVVACTWPKPACKAGACVAPPSCDGLALTCGPKKDESCCDSLLVKGGRFNRSNLPEAPAIVSNFRLDRFEVTAGRFRKFVAAWVAGYRPKAGEGRHSHLNDGKGLAADATDSAFEIGWDAMMTPSFPKTAAEWDDVLTCSLTMHDTWTDNHDNLPIGCVNWQEAAAFCTWDGGFLPSEAEWNYAAAGGKNQYIYPWGNTPAPDQPPVGTQPKYAAYSCYWNGPLCDIAPPGAMPDGDGFFGHADMAGNMTEWVLDFFFDDYGPECGDCFRGAFSSNRGVRGGAFSGEAYALLTSFRAKHSPSVRYDGFGMRCARTP